MTDAQFKKWKKNGNFKLSQEEILAASNHIAEGELRAVTKAEACEVAMYWSLEAYDLQQKVNPVQDLKILAALRRLERKLG